MEPQSFGRLKGIQACEMPQAFGRAHGLAHQRSEANGRRKSHGTSRGGLGGGGSGLNSHCFPVAGIIIYLMVGGLYVHYKDSLLKVG